VGYAWVMIYGLRTWWNAAVGTQFLDLHVEPLSLVIGFVSAVVVAMLAVWWALRQLRGLSARELLTGATEKALTEAARQRRGAIALVTAAVCALVAVALIVGVTGGMVPATEAFAGLSWPVVAFFVAGVALLTASLSLLAAWLAKDRSAAVRGHGLAGLGRLGLRNAARHRQRSVFTVGMIASATFVIVAVAAGHRNPAEEEPDKSSGNGGFTLVAETTQPILADLNSEAGREKLNLRFNERIQDRAKRKQALEYNELLGEMDVMPFRVKPGEDASCLNIYQTRLPSVLGVPRRMVERGGFRFVGAERENPWTLLEEELPPEKINGRTVPVVPVLGDMNTLNYSLHKAVGDTIAVPNEENVEFKLKIVGMLDGSVFQGVLLMSEENFLRFYRDEDPGYEYFLIEIPLDDATQLETALETKLGDYGFDAEQVSDRLAEFLAVQNTYLSTFQALGGLGLLLGTLGLATVMLRNVLERRAELALLRAVGFATGSVSALVLWENALLLLWGLVAGTVSALLAMLPHLTSTGADPRWLAAFVLAGMGAVFAVGMAAALLAVAEAVRTPIVATLRGE
ncbi:MAG: ABC transporter permease, partial [Planctomycetaceae bacterium]